ncbi:HD domain-containing protein [Myceligenerans xiligouense]|uniref:Putative metal-dependent HD superfamily phosphohydrolase n=1 Tax=Myceligenerans xiligouense TaxID=253184 RepID=A0A3N4ZG85_9MICO|nr:hypothetical protein [Myceligenerans xiligouense]RPF19835.1 putative metal-dependent HD superfamily phosphohydrolase [Myceligenerans xiligouense]
MGVMAPEWYISSFVRSATGIGATASPEEIERVGEDLVERWSGEDRHFHDLRHLGAVLHRVDELAEETHSPDVVRLAAWYHGAVFDAASKTAYASQGGEQTSASAELARAELTGLGVPAKSADRVANLVNGLLRHAPDVTDLDACVLNDADLAMLASEPQRYKEYTARVRAEYEHIPLPDYLTARIKVLSKLLARESLFCSPMGAAWEDPARQNLDAELHRLRKKQAALEADAG